MNYLDYLKNKLKATAINDVLENAVNYLADGYPAKISDLKGYEIVDNWFEKIKSKWNIEFNILNLSNSKFLAKLEPKKKGFVINLNKNLYTTKKRFTVAHEIAHILSYDTSLNWPVYQIKHSKIEEYFCDLIARSMILPRTLIDFRKLNLEKIDEEQIEFIKSLWKEFRVSPWQIILKLYEETDNKSLVCILWKYIQDESVLRITDYCKSENIFIPKKDRVELNNLWTKEATNKSPAIAFNTGNLFQGFDLVEIGSFYKKELYSTTFPIKTAAASYVFQIIKV